MDMSKIIYTDCDGVLLDWETGFHEWMERKGYTAIDKTLYLMGPAYGISSSDAKNLIKQFNESSAIVDLKPFRDARSAVARLVEAGYKFHMISSLSKEPSAAKLRIKNIEDVFGKDVFVDYLFLDTGADKDEVLDKLPKGSWWIEDKDENAIVGHDLDLRSLLVAHKHNEQVKHIPRFNTLNDLADHILTSAINMEP